MIVSTSQFIVSATACMRLCKTYPGQPIPSMYFCNAAFNLVNTLLLFSLSRTPKLVFVLSPQYATHLFFSRANIFIAFKSNTEISSDVSYGRELTLNSLDWFLSLISKNWTTNGNIFAALWLLTAVDIPLKVDSLILSKLSFKLWVAITPFNKADTSWRNLLFINQQT